MVQKRVMVGHRQERESEEGAAEGLAGEPAEESGKEPVEGPTGKLADSSLVMQATRSLKRS
jgi:hypothetical protein